MTSQPSTTATPHLQQARPHHDWHSREYVREWVEDNEARLAERRRSFDLIADFIPHPSEAPIGILDVGAGWGPVTRHLLARFPHAQAVLLDYSEEMFAAARPRLAHLGDRVRYVQGDLSQPGALARAAEVNGGPFDAIVSSSCIHNIWPTERIPALYREIREVTAPGGCFLNLDMVGSASPDLQAVWHRARVEQLRRRRQEETGTLPTYAAAEAELREQRRRVGGTSGQMPPGALRDGDDQPGVGQPTFASGGRTRSLLDHLTWLQQAGFDAVECFWRQDNRALLGGYVSRS
jgi:SAM-dependent methyltransferase